MQVKRGRGDRSLTEHNVDLPTMVGLMVEEVGDGGGGVVGELLASAVGVGERAVEEVGREMGEEGLDAGVHGVAGGLQIGEFIEGGELGERRVALEARHPDLVAAEDGVEEAANAGEGTGALFLVFGGVELRAFFEDALIGEAIVAGEHLEVGEEIHGTSLAEGKT